MDSGRIRSRAHITRKRFDKGGVGVLAHAGAGAGAGFVESNEAAELAEALEEKSPPRYFPIQVEMRHCTRRPHHIERSIAGNLISDAHVIAPRILCFWQHAAS